MARKQPAVEIAVQDVEGAEASRRAGASRVELCVGLPLGGLTPSAGLVDRVRSEVPDVEVHVLVRCRPGDFCYSPAEVAVMAADVAALEGRVRGIVVGAMTPNGEVDVPAVRAVVGGFTGEVTFHRAFDQVRDPLASLALLAGLGVSRVLTSGGKSTAAEGVGRLRSLAAPARALGVELMAGGGVEVEGIGALLDAGVGSVHLSAKTVVAGRSAGGVSLGSADDGGSGYQATDPQVVAAAVAAVRQWSAALS